MKLIKKAGVLGAGVMGSTIAAHLANAGLDVVMLDMVPRELSEAEENRGLTLDSPEVKNRIARKGWENLKKTRPAPFLLDIYADQIEIGNFQDHASKLQGCDWILEAVLEDLEIKKKLYTDIVVPHLKENAVVSTNTSGLSVNELAKALPENARKKFLLTHFFNPPRYMRLVEVVGCKEAEQEVVQEMGEFINKRLGKGVVYCKDTPNFVANRIGVYSIANCMQHMMDLDMSVPEVDAVAGKATGRPKTAAFKTIDLVGLNTMAHVARNSYASLVQDEERVTFQLPEWIDKMIANGQLGDKSKQGFYKKEKTAEGRQRYFWDYKAKEYKPVEDPSFESLKLAKKAKTSREAIRALIQGEDKAAQFAWKNLRDSLLYAFNRIPEIADDIVNVDNAMRWGFNWELGPFEMMDAIGVNYFRERTEKDGINVPDRLKNIECFYKIENGSKYYNDFLGSAFKQVPRKPEQIDLNLFKQSVLEQNHTSSILDMGNGVFCLEFNSPQNAISEEMLDMCIKCVHRAEKEGVGIVLGNQGERFSVGANLFMLLSEMQENNWDQIETYINKFQQATMALKYAHVPVVAAPFRMSLGGGCEFCLHCDAINAYVETYLGLVEMGAGVLPAGGGTKEMCMRAVQYSEKNNSCVQDLICKYFQNIVEAKLSQGSDHAFDLGYLRKGDSVSFDIDSLLGDAKQKVLAMSKNYRPKKMRPFKAPGRSVAATLKSQLWNLKEGNFITAYEYEIGSLIADVITGGDVNAGTLITEQYLLDLERAAFLQLCQNEKTRERMDYILKNNKALRN